MNDGADRIGQIIERIKNEAGAGAEAIVAGMSDGADRIGRIVEQAKTGADEAAEALVSRMNDGAGELVRAVEQMKETAENAASFVAGSVEKIKGVHNEFGTEFTVLAGQMDGYADKIGRSAEEIAVRGTEINERFGGLVEQINAESAKADSIFAALGEQMRVQSTAINDNFNRQREDLMDVVNLVSAQTRLGEAALNEQYKCLMDVSDAVSRKMTGLSDQFKKNTGGLQENAAAMSAEISALADHLLQIGSTMGQTTQNSIAGIEQVNQALVLCSDNLNQATDNAAANMNKVTEDYHRCLNGFGAVTEESNRALNEAAGLIAAQNDKMTQIAEDTKALTDYFNNLMNNASEQLIEKANVAHDRIRELGEGLQQLGRQLEETTGSSAEHFAASGEKLRSAVAEVMTDAERVAGEVRASHEAFKEQSDNLRATADETLTKVSEVMGSFSGSLEEFTAKGNAIVDSTSNFNGVIKKQIELLDIGAKQAGSELADIEKRYREMKVENFLKNATSIIEKLETLAVDINMIFNPESQDKLWQKYYEGDTDVFVRYLSRTMSRKQVVAIKEEFEKNPEFRKMVNAYMGEFEELINRARGCEKSGILLSVISGADIGKIYYVIARALDKLN